MAVEDPEVTWNVVFCVGPRLRFFACFVCVVFTGDRLLAGGSVPRPLLCRFFGWLIFLFFPGDSFSCSFSTSIQPMCLQTTSGICIQKRASDKPAVANLEVGQTPASVTFGDAIVVEDDSTKDSTSRTAGGATFIL